MSGSRAAAALGAAALVLAGAVVGRTTGTRALSPGARSTAAAPLKQDREADAVRAATEDVMLLGSDAVLDATRRHATLAAIAAPATARALELRATQAAELILRASRASRLPMVRTVPVGQRVDRFADGHADISIWSTSIASSRDGQAVLEYWGTEAVELEWTRGGWKLVALQSVEGPTPAAGGEPSAGASVLDAAQTFGVYGYERAA